MHLRNDLQYHHPERITQDCGLMFRLRMPRAGLYGMLTTGDHLASYFLCMSCRCICVIPRGEGRKDLLCERFDDQGSGAQNHLQPRSAGSLCLDACDKCDIETHPLSGQ